MRILPQQIQIKLQGLKTTDMSLKDIKVGDLLKALVLKVEPQTLTLALDQQTEVTVKVEDSARFVAGENLEFEVVSDQDQAVKVALVAPDTKAEVGQGTRLGLEALKVDVTRETVKAFEVLKSLDMPVTKANIQTLTQNYKALNVIHDQVTYLNTQKPMETPQALMDQLTKALSLADESRILEVPIKTLAIETLAVEREGALPLNVEGSAANGSQVVASPRPVLSSQVLKEAFGLLVDLSKDQLQVEDTMVKLTQLMQMDKPLTLNSLSLMDKLNFEFNLDTQMSALADVLEEGQDQGQAKLLALLKGFDMDGLKDNKAVKAYFEVLMSELDLAKEDLPTKVKVQIDQVKTAIHFLEQDQPQVTWIQVPMQMREGSRNLDLLMKENFQNKQNTDKKTKILIALNTHHLDLVQAYIEVKEHYLGVNFKVSDEKIKALFQGQIEVLRGLLIEEKDTVEIDVKSQAFMSYSEFVQETNSGAFTMKV